MGHEGKGASFGTTAIAVQTAIETVGKLGVSIISFYIVNTKTRI